QKWVTDMTELWVENQKVYISAVMDLFNREIIAFKISESPNQQLIKDTIEAAQRKRRLKTLEGVLIHSDRGSVYRSLMYHQLSSKLKFIPSMSRKANCWDNAVIESFFSQLKTEFLCFYPNCSRKTYRKNLLSFVKRFNEKRIQKRLGFISPKAYYVQYKNCA
ncbi:IS3 family transposase, partial [Virgibacillus kimchii]